MADVQQKFREGVVFHQTGHIDRAIGVYGIVLEEDATHAGALHLLGVALNQKGEAGAALLHIERALTYCDTKAVYWNNYGAVLKDLCRFADAGNAFARAVSIRPEYADAWSNLGLVQLETGDITRAEASLLRALSIDPRHVDAMRHLAATLSEQGKLEHALKLATDAVSLAPDRAEVHQAQGRILGTLRRNEEAERAFRRAVDLQPTAAEAHLSLGRLYSDQDDIEQAHTSMRRAAELCPNRPIWSLRHLGLCPTVFDTTEAVMAYRRNLQRDLDKALLEPPPLDWRFVLRDGFAPSFQLAHHGVCNRALKEKYAQLFKPAFPKHRPQPERSGRIRVAFTCTQGHEGGFMRGFGGLMQRLDRNRFQVIGFVSSRILDYCRRRIPSEQVGWIGVPHHLAGALRIIQVSRCDIVVHWHAGTDIMNYFLPFLPLAPVQCIGFGNHGTTGISNIDYFISSRLFERGDTADEDYTEQLIQFDGATSWQARPPVRKSASRDEFGLPATGAIYLCPQRLAKFQPSFIKLLKRVLEQDSQGHAVILRGLRKIPAHQLTATLQKTLGPSLFRRVVLLPTQKASDYYRLLSIADVVLDSPVYSASFTGYDAFSQGVPIVTLPGKHMVQRYALGLYRKMEIEDLIVCDQDQYVALSTRLGQDRDFRHTLCERIRERSHVLFEDDQVITEYEHLFHLVANGSLTPRTGSIYHPSSIPPFVRKEVPCD